MTGTEIQSKAFTDFNNWQSRQSQFLLDHMPIIQQAAHYAVDDEWHDRESDTAYDFRNN